MNCLKLLRKNLKISKPRIPRITQAGFIKFTKKTLASYLIIFIAFSGTAGFFLFNPFGTKQADAAWFNDNWAYRKAITVTNGSAFTDRFVHFDIDTTDAPDKFQADCGDIRFTDISGTILDYYYNTAADQCDNAGTDFYVNLNTILNGTMTIYMYYGNPSAVNGYLEGDFQGADVVVDDISYASEEKGTTPIAYWKFDDGQGSTTEDSTSNNKDGSITGGITWITEDQCLAGKCIDKPNASGSFVSVSSPNLPTGDFTYSGWVNLNNNDTETLFNASNGSATNELSVNLTSTKVAVYTDGSLRATSTNAVSTNTWTHIAVVRSGSGSNNIKIYINASEDSATGSDSGTTLNFGSCRLMIGATDASSCSGTTTSANLGGKMDEFKIYNQALTASQIKSLYNSVSNLEAVSTSFAKNNQNMPGALSNGLVGYWKMDDSGVDAEGESSTDSSGNANTGTLYGDNSTGDNGTGMDCTSTGKFGSGCDFDGTDDYVDITHTSALMPTQAITVAAWVNFDTIADDMTPIFKETYVDANNNSGYVIRVANTNRPTFCIENNSVNCISAYSSGAMSTGTWYHVVGTYDGSTVKIFFNGQLNNSLSYNGTVGNSTTNLKFSENFNGYRFDGKMDEVRIYNRALSPAEVSQLYNWAPGPVGYWKMDEGSGSTINDSSGNSYTSSSFSGNTAFTQGKYGKSLTFDGNDDVVRIPEGTAVDVGSTTSSYSISFWFNSTTTPASNRVLVGKWNGSGGYPFLIYINSSGQICFNLNDGSNGGTPCTSGSQASGVWKHIVAIRDISTDNLLLYLNGVLQGVVTDATTTTTANNSDISIGNAGTSYTNMDYTGLIDEVKIYNYARTQAQIIEDMNAGHPAPGSPISSAVAHWKLDEGYGTSAQDYSGNSNTLTLSSATAAWTNSGKFNKAWNGNGTLYLSKSDDSDFDVSATDDYSVSLWYKSDNASNPGATEYLFNKANATTAGYAIYANTSGNLCFAIDDDTTWSPDVASCTTTDVYDATWHHIVAVRDVTQDKTYLYLDGNLADSDTDSTSATLANSLSLYVGDRDGTDNGDEFNGDLDEIKVYRSALTAEQVKLDMNRSSSQVLGAVGTSSNQQPQSASNEYCPPDSSATVCTGPVGEWKFDEGSGTTANDSSGNANTGTLTSGPTWTNGKFNKAVNFDGCTSCTKDDIITAGSASVLDDLTTMTYSAWVYPKSTVAGTNQFILDKNDGSFTLTTGNTLLFSQLHSVSAVTRYSSTTVPLNRWSHVVATWDGSTTATNIRLYINGVETAYGTTTNGSGSKTSNASYNFAIGNKSTGSPANAFDGSIDQVRVFNYVRTPAQIAWEYNKGLPVAHYRMDECQGTNIYDASGNSLTGTLTIGASGTNTTAGTCQTSGAWYDGVAGKRNYSIDLDGTDDYLQISHNSIFDFGSKDFTISLWTKFNAIRTQILLEKFTESGGPGWSWYMLSSTQLQFFGCNNDICQTATTTSAFTTGQWYHLMITRSGSTYTTYVDGKVIGTAINGNDLTSSSNGITIGERDPSSAVQSFPLSSQVDDVRIYNYPLTATQANTLYNEGATRFGPTTGAP